MVHSVSAAVIVSFGSANAALGCVDSLRRGTKAPHYTIVVNNGPRPWGADEVTRLGAASVLHDWNGERIEEGATLVESSTNRGYSGALSLGASMLRRTRGEPVDFIWFLNNDLTIDSGALSALEAAASKSPGVGLWGATVCLDRDLSVIDSVGVKYSPLTTRRKALLRGTAVKELDGLSEVVAIDFVPGSAMFMRLAAFERCGGFTLFYFLYYEELELAAAVRAQGLEVAWCPDALVAHEGGLSTRGGRDGPKSAPVAFHSMRSAVIFTRRHCVWALPTVVAARFARHVLWNCLFAERALAGPALRGLVSGLFARGVRR